MLLLYLAQQRGNGAAYDDFVQPAPPLGVELPRILLSRCFVTSAKAMEMVGNRNKRQRKATADPQLVRSSPQAWFVFDR
jgi:hypothetical protein